MRNAVCGPHWKPEADKLYKLGKKIIIRENASKNRNVESMLDVKFFGFGDRRVLRYLVAGRGARRCDGLIPRRFWAVTLRGVPMSLELEIWRLLYQEEAPQVDVLCPDIYVIGSSAVGLR